MGVLTGRFTRYDITSCIVSGVNITSLLTDASLDITVDDIDANALKDTWTYREYGRADWSLSVTKLSTSQHIFPAMVVARALVGVTVILSGGIGFYTMGKVNGGPTTFGDMATEQATFTGAGAAPTINAGT